MPKFIDITGQKFGLLTVIKRSDYIGNGKKPIVYYDCLCDCGTTTRVPGAYLRSGHTVSCGCKKVKHGYSHKERLYGTWCGMKARCGNKNNPNYERYGGRGIVVCEEWRNDYLSFRTWALSNGYSVGMSIDRIDNDMGYSPDNCRWVTAKIQNNNQRKNRIIEYNGKKYTMAQFAEYLGLSYSSLQHRIERGWSIERIVTQKQRR